ncbi:MAG TPA: VWA domain-containing protein [Blastocatellia bacterium]|nr:VWA domain-containing protein [Blastocatellia bacterium]
MKKKIAVSLVLLFAAQLVLTGGAQEKSAQDKGEIRLSTELVQIDVLVTDKSNKPVSGLTREDFELLDNNKPQHISNFAYEETKSRRIEDAATEDHRLPRAITARELKRVFAFVVDTLHIKYENIGRTRKMLSDFVDNKMQPGDLVLILPTGGGSGLLQQFTADQRLLHRAIDRLRPFFFSNDTTPYRSMARLGLSPGSRPGQGARNGGFGRQPISSAGQDPDPFEEADVHTTLNAMKEMIKSMSKLPGRKVALLVSEGIRASATWTTQDLHETTALAGRANVVFYTIDPRGLDPLILNATDELDSDADFATAATDAVESKRSDFHESQDSLRDIALDTGGKFFGNNNDITRGLDEMLEGNAAYYMLGFYPEAGKWDGKLHKVKVVVRAHPELTVSFRKSYLAKSPPPEKKGIDPKAAEVIEAISSPLVRRDIDLRLTPLYVDNAQRDPVVTLLLHIDASKLTFVQSEGRYHDSLEEVGFVLDAKGNTIDRFSNVLDLNLLPQSYQNALTRGFVATRTVNMKPGTYQIRLFVRETGPGLIGTANDFIDIPNMKSNKLTTSSLFLSGQAVEQGKVVDTAGIGGTPSQRRFQHNGEFSYRLVIYNPKLDDKSKQPALEMRTRILKGTRVIFNGGAKPVVAGEGSTPPSRLITGGVIKLLGLPPDDYTIEVSVRDKMRKKEDGVIRREIDFSVE